MKTYLKVEEIILIEEQATNLRDRLLVRLLFHLGCRISEALALTVDDVDVTNNTVAIVQLKQRLKLACPKCKTRLGRLHTYCPGCGQKVDIAIKEKFEQRRRRILPIDNETRKMLKEYISRGGPVNRNGKLLLFGVNRFRSWQIVSGCANRAGIPRLTNPETGKEHNTSPHRLRDAFAVHAMKVDDSGDALRLLQEHLGHANFNTTAKYRKVSGTEHRDWYQRLWQKKDDK